MTAAIAALMLFAVRPVHRPIEEQPAQTTESIVNASADDVWQAFTTTKGQEGWNVAHAEFDLKVGGRWRTHYSKDGVLGDENSIEHTILSYDPKRMISFRTVKYPKAFPFKESFSRVWHVLYLESLEPKRTKITLRGLGYGDDEESKKCREFFERGNRISMESLKKYVEAGSR